MILETSAIVAILKNESIAPILAAQLQAAGGAKVSVISMLEASIVIGADRQVDLDDLTIAARLEVIPFTVEQLGLARAAYLKYGRGSGSKAKLNFGDCCSYALAKHAGEPLLFVGEDFTHTDVESAL